MNFGVLPVDNIHRHSGAGRGPEPGIQHFTTRPILDSGFALARPGMTDHLRGAGACWKPMAMRFQALISATA
jgi:hypothetical protein